MTTFARRRTRPVAIHLENAAAVLDRLSRVGLLRAIPPEEIQAILPYVELVQVRAGQSVMARGEPGDALYVIEDGRARVAAGAREVATLGPGEAVGEMALLTGEPRAATVTAETDLTLWRIGRDQFDAATRASPELERALRALADQRREGLELAQATTAERRRWRSVALRSLAARHRGLHAWQYVMVVGLIMWALVQSNELLGVVDLAASEAALGVWQLIAGLTILQGACEAFVLGVERLGARLRWEGFVSGTVGAFVATLPEFVVIAFLVGVAPLAAFVTAAVTIFNDALAFSIYSFFLPKDQKGGFLMPRSLAKAGAEVLIAGSGIALIVGAVMLGFAATGERAALAGTDLVVVGLVLIATYLYYVYTLVRYYAEGDERNDPNQPPDPHRMGHPTRWIAIVPMFLLGIVGAYAGGESIGGFADTALNKIGLPIIPTAAGLAFFAGISEYIIVWKAHRRGELGIALSGVFSGMTQVLFVLLPFALLTIAAYGFITGSPTYAVPITLDTVLLMVLLFPLFYVLLEYIAEDHTLNNLDAAAMTGIYVLLLYFLFTAH